VEKRQVKIINNYEKPKKPGRYFCLVCLTGANKGLSYYFSGKRVVLGRSDENDIQVSDGKSSREHAELTVFSNEYVVTDLGSHNGLYVNDLKVSQHHLVSGDNIIIGQTVYKYSSFEVEEVKTLTLVEEEDDEKVDLREDAIEAEDRPPAKKNKRVLVYGLVGLLVAFFLLDSGGTGKKGQLRKRKVKQLSELKVEKAVVYDIEDKDVRDKLTAFIHRGQREYREENYFRAIEQFEMALILVPNHGQASFYLRKSQDSLREYIKQMEAKAEQETASLRYRAALNQHCSIIAFLQNYPEDDRYVKAEKNINVLEEKIGYAPGEFKCY